MTEDQIPCLMISSWQRGHFDMMVVISKWWCPCCNRTMTQQHHFFYKTGKLLALFSSSQRTGCSQLQYFNYLVPFSFVVATFSLHLTNFWCSLIIYPIFNGSPSTLPGLNVDISLQLPLPRFVSMLPGLLVPDSYQKLPLLTWWFWSATDECKFLTKPECNGVSSSYKTRYFLSLISHQTLLMRIRLCTWEMITHHVSSITLHQAWNSKLRHMTLATLLFAHVVCSGTMMIWGALKASGGLLVNLVPTPW